jgi:hypothetical protein
LQPFFVDKIAEGNPLNRLRADAIARRLQRVGDPHTHLRLLGIAVEETTDIKTRCAWRMQRMPRCGGGKGCGRSADQGAALPGRKKCPAVAGFGVAQSTEPTD